MRVVVTTSEGIQNDMMKGMKEDEKKICNGMFCCGVNDCSGSI